MYGDHTITRGDSDRVFDVFVHCSSGVLKVRVKSATLERKFNQMVSTITGIHTHLYKLFYKNQPLRLKFPIGEQLNPGCSVFLHIFGKGGGGGGGGRNTSDLQGMYCCDYQL